MIKARAGEILRFESSGFSIAPGGGRGVIAFIYRGINQGNNHICGE